jgi:saccharopine dehydrogenase-like NADP-dependent oxidoreductase
MKSIALIGAGKIGRMVAHFLGGCGDYSVRVLDGNQSAIDRICTKAQNCSGTTGDFTDPKILDEIMQGADATISCAPYHCNPIIAERAKANKLHYFDLTEDVKVTNQVIDLAQGAETVFIPQCGLAPGFITIVAKHLLKPMTNVTDLRMRVGALPRYPDNRLKYNLTWSTEGLINEYCQPCEVLMDGELKQVQPLENLEDITIDGVRYEAFNTSGGLGSLAETLKKEVRNVSYKSIRYPGHNHLVKFLLEDMRMKDDQNALARMWDRTLPATFKDQVVIFVTAIGEQGGRLTENVFARTVYHQEIDGENWSGIQITTAAGVCGVVDLLFDGKLPQKGLVKMEDVDYQAFLQNRFGKYYA